MTLVFGFGLRGVLTAVLWVVFAMIVLAIPFAIDAYSPMLLLLVLLAIFVWREHWSEKNETPAMLITAAGIMALMLMSTLEILHATAYHDIFQVSTEQIAAPKLDETKAPLVSNAMAHQAAQKLLSITPGMGSEVEIGTLEKQIYQGKLVWVAYLEHCGFFKWLSNSTTPGYVVISASDASDAKLVTGMKMKYLASGWFFSDIGRAVWLKHPATLTTDYTPSIDPSGRPFWVVTTYQKKVGWSGEDADGIITVDAQTGEQVQYDLKDVPEWVNRVQPHGVVRAQASWFGEYVHGWFNATFSGKDVIKPSGEVDLIYGNDNRAYWYVAMTSAGSDNGISGYYLVDSKTKEAFWTQISGANDSVASQAVLGLVREKAYNTTNPLIFNVLGHDTYVMALTDGTGITRGYGLVNLNNYQVAVFGTTLTDAVRQYASKLDRSFVPLDGKSNNITATGKIVRFGSDVHSGMTTYFIRVAGVKPILTGTSEVSNILPLLAEGDTVTVKYMETEQETASLAVIQLGAQQKNLSSAAIALSPKK